MLVQPEVMFFFIPPTQVTSNLKLSLYLSLILFPVQPTLALSSYLEVKVCSGASCLIAVHQQSISQPHIRLARSPRFPPFCWQPSVIYPALLTGFSLLSLSSVWCKDGKQKKTKESSESKKLRYAKDRNPTIL